MHGNFRSEKSINRSGVIRKLMPGLVLPLVVIATITSFAVVASAQRRQGRVVNANDFSGQDLGARINAADRALGTARGEIVAKGGGTISTQVVVSSDHVLRFLPGTYVTRTATTCAALANLPR